MDVHDDFTLIWIRGLFKFKQRASCKIMSETSPKKPIVMVVPLAVWLCSTNSNVFMGIKRSDIVNGAGIQHEIHIDSTRKLTFKRNQHNKRPDDEY